MKRNMNIRRPNAAALIGMVSMANKVLVCWIVPTPNMRGAQFKFSGLGVVNFAELVDEAWHGAVSNECCQINCSPGFATMLPGDESM